jgi:SAM-dependent methyltransferase
VTREDHIALISRAAGNAGGRWADLGSGGGAFTAALCELLGARGRIVSVDRDARALRAQERELRARFPEAQLEFVAADFTDALPLADLDGIVMANSLHFQRDACETLEGVRRCLAPGGCVVVVEYDISAPNPWVPFPLPFARLGEIAACAGLAAPVLLGTRPSRYHRRVYAAVCRAEAVK